MNIEEITKVLNEGGVVVCPTDTVYGILCDATNIGSVRRIYKLKQRIHSKPMIVLASNVEMIEKYCTDINDLERKLINTYAPGELTIILKKSNLIPDIVTANMDSVGIRIPNDSNLLDIINRLNRPIVSTSANVSNMDTITSIDLLEESIKINVDYVYDGGYINRDPSTIVKVENNKIKILRDGSLSNDIKDRFKDYIQE